MKSKYLPIACSFAVSFILYACGKFPPKEPVEKLSYNKEGISFNYPGNWRISDDERRDEITYYVCCEKKGLEESGVFIITMITDSIELEDLLEEYKAEMEVNSIYGRLKFGENKEGKLNTFTTLSCKYSFRTLTIDHVGTMHGFYSCNKTFFVMIQEAEEDHKKNIDGFSMIESSFGCK